MNAKEFNDLVDQTLKQTAELLKSKGSEYASDADRLINFKKGAEETGLTSLQVSFVYLRKHYDSIATYIRKDAKGLTQTLSEPIEGRFHDLINYCFLMLAILKEQNNVSADRVRKALKGVEDTPVAGCNCDPCVECRGFRDE